LFQLSPCSPNALASVALTLPLPTDVFPLLLVSVDARK
jgi:hypothetical protein